MIILDTHIWVWWVYNDRRLPATYRDHITHAEADGLGVSAISCWEVARLVEIKKLSLRCAFHRYM